MPAMSGDRGLLEREAELEAIDAALLAAAGGAGTVTLLEGHPGLGKTRLAQTTAERAGTLGLSVLRSAGGELEHDLGWGVVRGLLGGQLSGRGGSHGLLQGAAAGAAPLFTDVELPAGADATAAILHGLYWLLSDLAAERPLAVVVDDVHWADAPSARWLAHLATRIRDLPVALLLAARPEPASRYWQAIAAGPATRLLRPAALSMTGTRALLSRDLGARAEELADACHESTGGNPFLLGELLRDMRTRSEGLPSADRVRTLRPESIGRSVLARLSALGEPATQLAFAAAILGRQARLGLVGELASLDAAAAAGAADALERAELIRVGPPLEFVHPLVLDVVVGEISAAQRSEWHRRAAELLQARGLAAGELAVHLIASEPAARPGVVATLRAAAREALAVGAPEMAAACLRRALDEPPPAAAQVDVLLELGRAEGVLTDAAGVGRLRQALAACGDPVGRGQITLDLAGQLLVQGAVGEAVAACDAAALDLPQDERELRFELFAHARIVAGQDLLTPPVDPPGLEVRELAGASKGERMLLAAFANGGVRGHDGPMQGLCEMATRALGDGALLADLTADGPQVWAATTMLMFGERFEEVERHIDAAVADSRERGSPRGYGFCLCFSSPLRYRLGELARASENARGAAEIFAEDMLMSTYALSFLVEALIDQGVAEEAARAIEGVELEGLPPVAAFARLRACRGRLRHVRGDVAGAVEDLLAAGEQVHEFSPVFLPWRADAALALRAAGELDRARALARAEVASAEAVGSAWAQAYALHALGLVEDDLEPLRHAELLTRERPLRLERARVLVELGAGLSRRGKRSEAIPFLSEGLDLADRCGAGPIAAHAREQLRAAGARPRRARISGRDALTPSELRVCRMASAGMSNREIAQALFVSLRTVETHLTRSYAKLEVGGREQLREVLDGVSGDSVFALSDARPAG
jgi:DNA-binding CsgD family transcriptional regulator